MKLLKQVRDGWEYEMSPPEAMCLRTLIKQFPLTPATAVKITRSDSGGKVVEREQLLNESLAEHREELKRKALQFLTAGHFKTVQSNWRLRLNPEERETLLQLLNDIRVGSWRALGEPESLDSRPAAASESGLNFHTIMQLAGFFECKLLNLETDDHPAG
jgi:hypothetical protein